MGEHDMGEHGSTRGNTAKQARQPSTAKRDQPRSEVRNRPSAAPKAAGKAAKPPREDMHARSARLQREGHLPAEVQQGAEKALPGSGTATRVRVDPFHGPSDETILRLYGEHQYAAHLANYMHDTLREAAIARGIQPGRSKAITLSRLTAHATQGRYSANFGTGKGNARGKASPAAARAAHTAKAAKLKAALETAQTRLAKAQAAYDAHLAREGNHNG